jgi:Family of unknown function (DUF6325)
MSLGPVEYVIIGFPGSEFSGEIVPALADLVESGQIRIIDLVFVAKDDEGAIAVLEADEHEAVAVFSTLDGAVGDYLGLEDIEHAAAAIEPGSSAALLVWEDVWAAPFADAVRNSGGVLIEGGRIPVELMDEAEALASAHGRTETSRCC